LLHKPPFVALTLLPASTVSAQAPTNCSPPQCDTSLIDDDGTAHITRVIPVPDAISREAQKVVAEPMLDTEAPYEAAKDRAMADAWQAHGGETMRKDYPVNMEKSTIAGVPVKIVTPLNVPADRQNRVLINLHGGGLHCRPGFVHRDDSHRQSHPNQSRRCALFAGAGTSIPDRR
jgi:monoterpene epsilon-lactone hydrolase